MGNGIDLSGLSPTPSEFTPYHKGYDSRGTTIPNLQRRFIAWDGEGMNLAGVDRPQSYVLFGASTGDLIKSENLRTREICQFVIDVGKRYPGAWHIGFAFTYDANMIVRSLSLPSLRKLYRQGFIHFGTDDKYCITLRPGKWLAVTRYGPKYDRKQNPHDKQTVRIYDIFSFFGKSFVASVREYLGELPELAIVDEGKALRGTFTDIEYVERYWRMEIDLLERLANSLRDRVYAAGLKITQWHGPGALASYAMKHNGIKSAMTVNEDAIREASRYAYAGGRFELFKVGRINGPVYSVDINSAYPYAISKLPDLSNGHWRHVKNPKRIARFGVYHVRLQKQAGFQRRPGPLFHRDERHNISYPWIVEGWYWSPEVTGLLKNPHAEIIEGWEYLGSKGHPFAWVNDLYRQRQQWKAEGHPAQVALKLCLNSLYGKMAQRVGWDEKRNRIPPWHQLEWAGWVTAYTRSMLHSVMSRVPFKALIAVETDGVYTTVDPFTIGISNSKQLGGWEVTQYDEIIYIQSGLAFLRSGDEWTAKYRGLDKGSFTREDAEGYLETLLPNEPWKPYAARTTRFIGLGAAFMTDSTVPFKNRHCRWETTDRFILPGEKGKRIHIPQFCSGCKANRSAADAPHDLVIRSASRAGVISTPHSIPWEDKDTGAVESEWRDVSAEYEWLFREGT